MSSLSTIELIPKGDILTIGLVFTLECIGVINPSSDTSAPSIKLVRDTGAEITKSNGTVAFPSVYY